MGNAEYMGFIKGKEDKMPKEIKDLKEFIKMMRREKPHLPKPDKITIKKNKKTGVTKLKLRTPKYLYTTLLMTRARLRRSCSPSLPTSRRSIPTRTKSDSDRTSSSVGGRINSRHSEYSSATPSMPGGSEGTRKGDLSADKAIIQAVEKARLLQLIYQRSTGWHPFLGVSKLARHLCSDFCLYPLLQLNNNN